jgi:hypothetical protein
MPRRKDLTQRALRSEHGGHGEYEGLALLQLGIRISGRRWRLRRRLGLLGGRGRGVLLLCRGSA